MCIFGFKTVNLLVLPVLCCHFIELTPQAPKWYVMILDHFGAVMIWINQFVFLRTIPYYENVFESLQEQDISK